MTKLMLGGGLLVLSAGALFWWATKPSPTIPLLEASDLVTPGYYDYEAGETGWTFMYKDGHWEQVNNEGFRWTDGPGSHPVP